MKQRDISASTGMSKGTVGDCLQRAKQGGLDWEEGRGMDDQALEERLFRSVGKRAPPSRVTIDFPWVHREMRKSGTTLMLLWSEYAEAARQNPTTGVAGMSPYGYSQFCDLFARYQGKVDLVMRQEHRAGEKVFVDYSGKRPCYHDMAVPAGRGSLATRRRWRAAFGSPSDGFWRACETACFSVWRI